MSRNAWLILVAVVAVLGAGGLGIFVTEKQHAHANVSAKEAVVKTQTVRIPVQGMICVVCAGNVKKTLESIDGVQEAQIDLERREARVRYVEGRVSSDRLVASIDKLGYKAGTPIPEASSR